MQSSQSTPSPRSAASSQASQDGLSSLDRMNIQVPFDPSEFFVPDDATCYAYWKERDMPEHIGRHSSQVANIATALARRAAGKHIIAGDAAVQEVRSSALLHDLAKMYCINYGGHHSQLGAAWVMEHTGNPMLAHGVLHHVWWPYEIDCTRYFLPLAVLYADKRVRHDEIVSIHDRFTDLFDRYGANDFARDRIRMSMEQSQAIEENFIQHLGVNLHACTFDNGRLVD